MFQTDLNETPYGFGARQVVCVATPSVKRNKNLASEADINRFAIDFRSACFLFSAIKS